MKAKIIDSFDTPPIYRNFDTLEDLLNFKEEVGSPIIITDFNNIYGEKYDKTDGADIFIRIYNGYIE